ncbi:MAG: TonB-dependent receptor [Gammaproteobacteria bacterium]|nr:TonB-dependent receptor [Gammaproteobacteria bacterium]
MPPSRRSLAFLFVACAPGLAQAAAETALDTIVVTASRQPIELARVGASVTVLDRDFIERRQAMFVADLLRAVPGVAVSRSGGLGKQTQLRMRGAEGNHVMVLLDGIEINDLAGNDEFDFANLTTADVERIEVVRGPQSALWGSEALAGVINIITRKGGAEPAAELTLEAGSFATTQQRVAMAVGGERGRLRVGVGRIDSGGTNVSRFGDEDDAYHGLTIDANGALELTPGLDLSFVLRNVDSRTENDSGVVTGVPVDTPGISDSNQTYLGTRADLSLFDGRWTQRAEANWTSTSTATRDPAVFQQGTTSGDRYEITYQSSVWFETSIAVPVRHGVTFATDHEYQRFRQRGPVTPFGDPNQERGMHNTGITGEYRATLAGQLDLAGSVRRDLNSDFRDVTTYRGSAAWRTPWFGSVVSLAYATGQKAPTFIERFGFASGGLFGPVFIGNAGLEPEHSRGWEVGLRQPLWGDRLHLAVTWFAERLEDEIFGYLVDATGTRATAINQGGTSRRGGLEFAADATLPYGLLLDASYTYLDATELDRATGLRKDEVRRPNHQASLALDWRSPAARWTVGTFVTYSGAFEDLVFLPPSYAQQRVRMDSYVLVGGNASLTVARGIEFHARIENAFDEHYEELFGFRAPGLAAYLGLHIDFFPH